MHNFHYATACGADDVVRPAFSDQHSATHSWDGNCENTQKSEVLEEDVSRVSLSGVRQLTTESGRL